MKNNLRFRHVWLVVLMLVFYMPGRAQRQIGSLKEIDQEKGSRKHYLLVMGMDTYGQPVHVPVIVIRGHKEGPALGLIAAIHGNELNGINIIHKCLEQVDPGALKGTLIAVPGINAISITQDRRHFIDEEDLNRNFPGKATGNRSQQYTYRIMEGIVPYMDYVIDMHTASFGRVNSFYVRADMADDTLAAMAELQGADIILHSEKPSAGEASASETLRGAAAQQGKYAITVEYGDPQVYQPDMINRGIEGIVRTMEWLGMKAGGNKGRRYKKAVHCKNSYWIYMKEGGFLEVTVEVGEKVKKGQKIALVRDGFGTIQEAYVAPEAGIVIGKSTNPANMSGGRIIHLGIVQEE